MGLLSKLVKKVGKKSKPISGRQRRMDRLFGGRPFSPSSDRFRTRARGFFGDMIARDLARFQKDPNILADQKMADRGMIGPGFQDFSKRSGSGGFIPGGDGRLIPIRDSFSVGMPSPDLPVPPRPLPGSPRSGRPRFGFGLGELLPRIKDKVPLAPVFSGMPIPQMVGRPQMLPQPISRVPVEENISEISTPDFAMRDVQMDMMEPRMMMADGDVALSEEAATDSLDNFLNADPEQLKFGIESRISNITAEQIDALNRGDMDVYSELGEEKRMLEKRMAEIIIEMGRQKMIEENPYNLPFDPDAKAARERLEEEGEMLRRRRKQEGFRGDDPSGIGFADGGEASFPDLTGDGKVTQADILKGRGVFAEGDEVSMMLMEMDESDDMSEEEMEGLEGLSEVSGPETEMLNNIINQIIELIAQGATEEEIIKFLMEQGLDEEDITEVMSMLSQEMTAGGEEDIDSQLAALG